MAQVTYSFEALADLDRLEKFLEGDPAAAAVALLRIFDAIEVLQQSPEIGRPIRGNRRELVISRGKSGYLAMYEFDPIRELVRILRIRHQRESGYPQ